MKREHLPVLDGLRGFAALAVLFFHLFYSSMYEFLTWRPLGDWTGAPYLVGQMSKYGWAGAGRET